MVTCHDVVNLIQRGIIELYIMRSRVDPDATEHLAANGSDSNPFSGVKIELLNF